MCFFRFLLKHKSGGNVSIIWSSLLQLRTLVMMVVVMRSCRTLEEILRYVKLQSNKKI